MSTTSPPDASWPNSTRGAANSLRGLDGVRARGAPAEHREMARVDHKAVLALRRVGQGAKESLGRFHLSPAHLTDQVSVRLGGKVVRRRSVSQMRMDDDAESLEFIEIAVDRREMNVRRNPLHLFGEFFGGPMGTLFEEAAQQDPSRGRGATAAFAKEIQDLFDPVNVGRGLVAGVLGG
jgi:hypothetical protein